MPEMRWILRGRDAFADFLQQIGTGAIDERIAERDVGHGLAALQALDAEVSHLRPAARGLLLIARHGIDVLDDFLTAQMGTDDIESKTRL